MNSSYIHKKVSRRFGVVQPYRHLIIFHSLTMHTCTFVWHSSNFKIGIYAHESFAICFEGWTCAYETKSSLQLTNFFNLARDNCFSKSFSHIHTFFKWKSDFPIKKFSECDFSLKFRHRCFCLLLRRISKIWTTPFFMNKHIEWREKGFM